MGLFHAGIVRVVGDVTFESCPGCACVGCSRGEGCVSDAPHPGGTFWAGPMGSWRPRRVAVPPS